jgi:hypothetical protein
MKVNTVQSVLAVMLSFHVSIAMAAPPSIGVAVTQGSFRVDNSTVAGNATLLEGTTVETQRTVGSIELAQGARLALSADSKARVYGDHTVLEKGSARFEKPLSYRLEARGLTIQPDNGIASARVAVSGAKAIEVAALTGSFRVLNANGVLVASLAPGTALELEQQGASNGEPWKLAGCLKASSGHFTLTDDTTNVTVETTGVGLDAETGNRVEVTGTMDPAATPVSGASQLIRVNQLKRLGKGCGVRKGAAAAGAGGAAAGATIAGISATTVAIIGGAAAAAVVGGLAAGGKLSGSGSANTTSR